MTVATFDTHAAVKALTKADLKAELAAVERRMMLAMVALIGGAVALLKLLP